MKPFLIKNIKEKVLRYEQQRKNKKVNLLK